MLTNDNSLCILFLLIISTLLCCYGSTSVSWTQKPHKRIQKSNILQTYTTYIRLFWNKPSRDRDTPLLTHYLLFCHGSPWAWQKNNRQKKKKKELCLLWT